MAAEGNPRVSGLAFLGFPLHPSGKPSIDRGEHLSDVEVPMLFVQGTRDALADLKLLRKVTRRLATATVHIIDGGDHSFHVLKRSGRDPEQVLDEIADTVRAFFDQLT
jgi:predicted alpha/beta-hydrolase family hydrolase